MGKTLELLALMLAHRPTPAWTTTSTCASTCASTSPASGNRRVAATLVVLPPALIGQWRGEARLRASAAELECVEWQSRPPREWGAFLRKKQAKSPLAKAPKLAAALSGGGGGGGAGSGCATTTTTTAEARSSPHVLVLASYGEAAEVAACGLTWWRVVLDEPHAHLTAHPRSGTIEAAPLVHSCAAIDAPNRWIHK